MRWAGRQSGSIYVQLRQELEARQQQDLEARQRRQHERELQRLRQGQLNADSDSIDDYYDKIKALHWKLL